MRRRSLVVSLALVAILSLPAAAQTCLGLAPYTTGTPLQIAGKGSLTSESTSFGAGVGYGLPSSVFGSLGVGTRSDDNLGGSALEIGAAAGYQIAVGNTGSIQLCPIADFGVGIGPRNTFNSGVDRSRTRASLGFAIATSLTASPRMKIVPSLALSYVYQKDQAQNNAGATLFQIGDRYALAHLGVGLVLDSNISVRPGVDIPFTLDVNDPSFGLTVSYHFGHKR
jgi:hypothetical protein